MDTSIEHIIKSNKYEDLTSEDVKLVSEYASNAKEYEQLRAILLSAPTLEDQVYPSENLESKLMSAFDEQYGEKKEKIIWLRPAILSAAAVIILALIAYPVLKSQDPSALQTAQLEKEDLPLPKSENEQSLDAKIERVEDVKTEQEKAINDPQSNSNSMAPTELDQEEVEMPLAFTADSSFTAMEERVVFDDAAMPTSAMEMSSAAMRSSFAHPDVLTKNQILKSNQQLAQKKPELLEVLVAVF